MARVYWIEGSEVWVADPTTGEITWHGRPDGHAPLTVLPVPGADDSVVLLDWMSGPPQAFQNVVRLRPDGTIVWRAELPPRNPRPYAAVGWKGGRLWGTTWGSYLCDLDQETGRLRAATFTK
jgi:outer membrane protein assembly factor BamB